jgi:hypothetical protein
VIVRRAVVLIAAGALIGCSTPEQEVVPPFPITEIRLADWGIEDLTAVRVGRVSEVPSRRQLTVHALWTELDLTRESGPSESVAPAFDGPCLVVEDLRPRSGGVNALGGRWGVFQREPSAATLTPGFADDGVRVLEVEATRATSGFCGVWMQLHDAEAEPRRYLDGIEARFLELWLRGVGAPSAVTVRIADERLDRIGESMAVAPLSELARSQGAWTRVTVPLDRLPAGVDRRRLASVALEITRPGEHRLQIGGVGLCREPGALAAPIAPRRGPGGRHLQTAMWVWETDRLLSSRSARRDLVAFVAEHEVTDVLLQIPVDRAAPSEITSNRRRRARLRDLIERLGEVGCSVHALDGHPTYGRLERLEDVVRGVDSVAAFNRESPPGQRFVGVHYDIEPYLLPGFGSSRRGQILAEYLEVVQALAERAREHALQSAVDIPFWFDARDEDTRQDMRLPFGGRVALPSRHVLGLVDAVYIMDYRTVVGGADGILAHAAGELELAEGAGAQVVVGLETHALDDERTVRFRGEPSLELPPDAQPGSEAVVAVVTGETARIAVIEAARVHEFLDHAEVAGGERVLFWSVDRSTEIPASRISFAGADPRSLSEAMAAAAGELGAHAAFAGFAIHHYDSWRRLLQPE